MLETILGLMRSTASPAEGRNIFARLLIGSAGSIDFDRFSPEDLAQIAADGFAFVVNVPANGRKVRVRTIEHAANGATTPGKRLTVLQLVNHDMPFLVDSVIAEIQSRDLEIYFVAHPIFKAVRDGDGKLSTIIGPGDSDWSRSQESYIEALLEPVSDDTASELQAAIEDILQDVSQVVKDWKVMLNRLNEMIEDYEQRKPRVPEVEFAESIAFLRWLADGNFTLLGVRDFKLEGGAETGDLVPQGGLGILRNPDVRVLRRGKELVHMTPEVRRFYFQPAALIVTKSNVRSKVHRRTHMDYVGAKIYGDDGRLCGELRIVGLFTSTAYTQSVRHIPLLRKKAERVFDDFGHPPDSHSGKALANVLETFPRDELFQISQADLASWTKGILDLGLRPRTRVFARIDEFDRFASILVYIPRDRYTTAIRQRIGEYLAETYRGRLSAFSPSFGRGTLVRVQFIIGRDTGETPIVPQAELEANVQAIVRSWHDDLAEAIMSSFPAKEIQRLTHRYATAFGVGFTENFSPERAIEDIRYIELLSPETPVAIDFYREESMPSHGLHVALYRLDESIQLSRRVPIFENMGFAVIDERSYTLKPFFGRERRVVRLHDMVLETEDGLPIDLSKHKQRLEDCFLAVWNGRTDDDHFNRLIKSVGLTWRDAAIARSLAAYMRQIRAPYGQRYISDTLVNHIDVTRHLFDMFEARFDPDSACSLADRDEQAGRLFERINHALAEVPSLDEDRILRQYANLIQSMLRTNFYRHAETENPPDTITFKFDSKRVENAPEPRPHKEIFVFAPRVEGIHLRGGPIARGGLRWSDRAQDFRTEVLGLAKAQQVKNAVIVPAGAKGGFVPKRLPREGAREEFLAEGVAAYELFISNLVDLTDNIEGDTIIPPERVVRHDGDDPYLVVAADKGTATFSDYANGISEEHGFWMGDAFASGGSAGYDHKKMGITARGGWEAVKRHFREMDRDIQTSPVTVLGVGDMSGDVFGNGMLLSREIRLLAAFDHRDIFIDPDPDPAASWTERKRLFDMGRSSWQDYDLSLVSEGGMIASRASKSISLTPQVQAMTGLSEETVTPNQLIRSLLNISADLLWFGGIGTYVKASGETDEEVGDRANDAIRVAASDLAVKVIGEGANLGATQRGRVEFALKGGRVNTDAIDNSAGVNSSDLEVNIKIALRPAVISGAITMNERNEVLASMTEEVADACLRNNYLQSLALSLGEQRGISDLGFQKRLMRELEKEGLLDRVIEDLPNDIEIDERSKGGKGLTRPELAVLLGYAKISLFDKLINSPVPDDPYLDGVLHDYFPTTMRDRFSEGIDGHRLRREIIATVLTNEVINRGGSTMVVRLAEETGHDAADIVYAFAAVRMVFCLEDLWRRLDALDNKVPGTMQLALYLEVQHLVRRQTAWFLRHHDFSKGLADVDDIYGSGIASFSSALGEAMTERQRQHFEKRVQYFLDGGLPDDLASDVARLDRVAAGPDAVSVAVTTGKSVNQVVRPFCEVDDYFRIGELRAAGEAMPVTDYFDRLAINSTLSILTDAHRSLTEKVLAIDAADGDVFQAWRERNGEAMARTKTSLDEILDGTDLTLARLAVAASQARDLVPSAG